MCVTNIWAIDTDHFTPAFVDFSEELLGVRPEISPFRLKSSRVPAPTTTFTARPNWCDCDGVIGKKADDAVVGETPADALIMWMNRLPRIAPFITRLVLVSAWSPDEVVTPKRSTTVSISDINERFLRYMAAGTLVAIDYPPANYSDMPLDRPAASTRSKG